MKKAYKNNIAHGNSFNNINNYCGLWSCNFNGVKYNKYDKYFGVTSIKLFFVLIIVDFFDLFNAKPKFLDDFSRSFSFCSHLIDLIIIFTYMFIVTWHSLTPLVFILHQGGPFFYCLLFTFLFI